MNNRSLERVVLAAVRLLLEVASQVTASQGMIDAISDLKKELSNV